MKRGTVLSICWNLTSVCNMECGFCYRPTTNSDATLKNYETVLDRVVLAGIRRLVLTGGEPLLVRSLPRILEAAKERGLMTSLATNGLLMDRLVLDKLKRHIDEIALSFNSCTTEGYAAMAGTSRLTHSHLLGVIDLVVSSGLRLRINTAVTSRNMAEIMEIGAEISNKGISEWRLLQFFPINRAFSRKSQYALPSSVFGLLQKEILKLHGAADFSITFGTNETMAGSYLSILPDGKVVCALPGVIKSFGNILHGALSRMKMGAPFNEGGHARQYAILREKDAITR